MSSMIRFAIPMILGNLLQQCYNVADTLIVGQFLGPDALAAVGSAYTLMTFITSILLGLCMGSGALFSIRFGERDYDRLKEAMAASFVMIASICVVLNILVFLLTDQILWFLRVPDEVWDLMREYLVVIFYGIIATFLYNYFASLLRAIGDSATPLIFLAVSAVLNIVLDLWFVVGLERGVAGAAEATVISQYVSGVGVMIFTWFRKRELRPERRHLRIRKACLKEISGFSLLTCVQQSVMNLGILMVQGLVNSFGPAIMAAFAAAVKIDSFAYMPVQDFGNAFSTFIAQNYGARKQDRIKEGLKGAVITAVIFSITVSALVFVFAPKLMLIFVDAIRGRDNFRGCKISEDRGGILLRNRLSLPALRPLSCPWKAGDVSGAYSHIPWHESGPCLYTFGDTCDRSHRHMVVSAHRLVPGRCRRNWILSTKKGQAYDLKHSCAPADGAGAWRTGGKVRGVGILREEQENKSIRKK